MHNSNNFSTNFKETSSNNITPIPIHFSLLGTFRIQTSIAAEEYATGTYAVRILAYLAFHRGNHEKRNVFEAAWGREFDPKEDELTYTKQINNVIKLITKFTGGASAYLVRGVNNSSIGLAPGIVTTDIDKFNELTQVGLSDSSDIQGRIKSLIAARQLYRGYFLQGLGCSWAQENGGAGAIYADKCDNIDKMISQLEEKPTANLNQMQSYEFYEMQRSIINSIESANDEIILYSMNYRVIFPSIKRILFEKLKEGKLVKILFLDPFGAWLRDMALASNTSVDTLYHDCRSTASELIELQGKWREEVQGDIEREGFLVLRAFDNMIHGRMYIVDPERTDGILYFTPYLFGVDPTLLPGYSCRKKEVPFIFYVHEIRKLLDDEKNSNMRTIGEKIAARP